MSERPNELKTVDTATAIEASTTWKRLAGLVPTIELYLEPRRGKSEVRMPPGSKLPLDVIASDLLLELDQACDFYIAALMLETPDINRFPDTLSERLHLVGQRYGHFTTTTETRDAKLKGADGKTLKNDHGDPYRVTRSLGFDYCDEAHEFLRKVGALVLQPLPPQWMGPCQQCPNGELWLKPGRMAATCNDCGSAEDLGALRQRLHETLHAMLVRRPEIVPALRLLGSKVTTDAVHKWVQRGRLVPVLKDPEVFRMSDALALVHDLGVAV